MFAFNQDSGGRCFGVETEAVTAAELKRIAAETCRKTGEETELLTIEKYFAREFGKKDKLSNIRTCLPMGRACRFEKNRHFSRRRLDCRPCFVVQFALREYLTLISLVIMLRVMNISEILVPPGHGE